LLSKHTGAGHRFSPPTSDPSHPTPRHFRNFSVSTGQFSTVACLTEYLLSVEGGPKPAAGLVLLPVLLLGSPPYEPWRAASLKELTPSPFPRTAALVTSFTSPFPSIYYGRDGLVSSLQGSSIVCFFFFAVQAIAGAIGITFPLSSTRLSFSSLAILCPRDSPSLNRIVATTEFPPIAG